MAIKDFAQKVAAELPNENYQFDPTIIVLIMEAIMQVIQTLMDNCNQTPEELIKTAKNPGFLQKTVLRLRTRRAMGARTFRECGDDVVNGMVKVTAQADPTEIQAIYDEVDVF